MYRTFGTGYSSQAGFEKISQSSVACAGTGRRKTDAKARLSAELAKDLILTFPPYVFLKLTSRFESCDFHVSQMTLPNKLLPHLASATLPKTSFGQLPKSLFGACGFDLARFLSFARLMGGGSYYTFHTSS